MLKKLPLLTISLLSFLITSVTAHTPHEQSPSPLDSYFKYLTSYPDTLGPIGNAKKGEIEIVQDKEKIAAIEKKTGRTVGVIAEDKYWLWLNDALKFPNNTDGVCGRFLWKSSLKGRAGVAVMAVLPNGKIALNRNFRHATRSWEYELPRGARNPNEKIEDTAKREVIEETGMIIQNLALLGEIAVDSGTLNTISPIYYAKVTGQKHATPEDSEAIASVDTFSVSDLKEGFIKGYLVADIHGQKQKIPLRDPFLAYALFMAELKGFFQKNE